MNDLIEKYSLYIFEVIRRRWLVLVATATVCGSGWPIVFITPDTYEVTAKIQLDTETILNPLLRGLAVDSNMTEKTAMLLQRTMLNRANLEKVARAADLDLLARTPADFDRIIVNLASNIDIAQLRIPGGGETMDRFRDDVYAISSRNKDPAKAKKIVEEVLDLFVEGVYSASSQDNEHSRDFLEKQIKIYEEKLVVAEDKLKEFKRKNVGLMPREGQNFYTQVNADQEQLQQAKLELDQAAKKRNELARQLDSIVSSMQQNRASTADAATPLDVRIRTNEERLDDLLLRFTESHPDVISTKRILDDLYKKREAELKNKTNSQKESMLLENNPVYQELKVKLGEEEANIAALNVRVQMYEDSLAYLNRMIGTIPEIEAELAKLNRDYDVVKEHYVGLAKRREAAQLSAEAELGEKTGFKILDPPRIPLSPISPNRPLLQTAIFILGVGVGIGMVILMMFLKPAYNSLRELGAATGLPVFGSVSMLKSPIELKRSRVEHAVFFASAFMMFTAYAAVVASNFLNIKL